MKPYWSNEQHGLSIYLGDCLDVLAALPAGIAQCCVTSPPYWGLRDYGIAEWEGGDPECKHKQGRNGAGRADGKTDERGQRNRDGVGALTSGICAKCGAVRVDRQLGLERTPDCGMAGMIRLKKGLTEDQLQYVVRELLALASPCDAEHDKADKE